MTAKNNNQKTNSKLKIKKKHKGVYKPCAWMESADPYK